MGGMIRVIVFKLYLQNKYSFYLDYVLVVSTI